MQNSQAGDKLDAIESFLLLLIFFTFVIVAVNVAQKVVKKWKEKQGDKPVKKKKTSMSPAATKTEFNRVDAVQVPQEKTFKLYICPECKLECTSRERLEDHYNTDHGSSLILSNQQVTYRLVDMEEFYRIAGREYTEDKVSDAALTKTVARINERFGGDIEHDKIITHPQGVSPAEISDLLYKQITAIEQKKSVPGEFNFFIRDDTIFVSAQLSLFLCKENLDACNAFINGIERKPVA